MAGTTIQPTGGGTYIITVNGHTYHVTGQRPGSVITVGGKKVTLPNDAPAPAAPALSGTYHPGVPLLDPDQQLQFNQQLDALNNNQIDLGAGVQQAHTNYERTIADLAHNALVNAQTVEENMAARGQYDSGIRTAALTDLEAHRALSADRASQDLRAADVLYETKNNAVNTARGSLSNWYTLTTGANAAKSSYIEPAPGVAPGVKPPTPASTVGAPGAHGAQGQTPAGYTPPPVGHAAPATKTTYASGPPPGPGYQWNGVRWVKVR